MADALDLYLAEYNSLREEQLKRIEIQFNSLTWLFTVIGGVFAAVTFIYEKAGVYDVSRLTGLIGVFLPLAAGPIAFMMFDHAIMVHRIGHYISSKLHGHVFSVLNNPPAQNTLLCWDPKADATPGTLFTMKYFLFLLGSWFLFFLVIPVATALVLILHWGAWPYPYILVLDSLISIAFLYASAAAWNERAEWLGLKKVPWL